MINNRLYRNGLNGLNGANRRHEAFGRHGAGGLRGLRCGSLSFIIYYLSFIISLTCLSACCSHSDDTPEPTPTPGPVVETGTSISFSGQETEAQDVSQGVKGTRAETRAGTPLSEKTGVFTVWGYKNLSLVEGVYGGTQMVFPGYRVVWHSGSAATTTTNTNGWEYVAQQTGSEPEQTIKYWDWDAKAYRFFAVTGTKRTSGDLAIGEYKTDELSGSYEITLSANASSESDMNNTPFFSRLWFSTGILPTYADKQFGKPVVLEFLKPYARARFIFKYSYPREGIQLTEVSFAPTDGSKIARKGTVTVHYPKEGKEIREWYTMMANSDSDPEVNKALTAFTEDYDPEDDGKTYSESDKGWYMVLPNNEQGTYTLSVKVNGKTKTATVPEQYMQWLPGYSYTYVFKVTDEGGVEIGWVEYAVTPWDEYTGNRTVYNW